MNCLLDSHNRCAYSYISMFLYSFWCLEVLTLIGVRVFSKLGVCACVRVSACVCVIFTLQLFGDRGSHKTEKHLLLVIQLSAELFLWLWHCCITRSMTKLLTQPVIYFLLITSERNLPMSIISNIVARLSRAWKDPTAWRQPPSPRRAPHSFDGRSEQDHWLILTPWWARR